MRRDLSRIQSVCEVLSLRSARAIAAGSTQITRLGATNAVDASYTNQCSPVSASTTAIFEAIRILPIRP